MVLFLLVFGSSCVGCWLVGLDCTGGGWVVWVLVTVVWGCFQFSLPVRIGSCFWFILAIKSLTFSPSFTLFGCWVLFVRGFGFWVVCIGWFGAGTAAVAPTPGGVEAQLEGHLVSFET